MQEKELQLMSGFLAVFFHFITPILMLPLMLFWPVVGIIMVPIASVLWFVCLFGYIVNSPNQARVVQFFGSYVGTVRQTGFFWGNPLYWKTYVSLRGRTFETGQTGTDEVKDPSTGKVIQAAT
ncbi:MAG: SPFH domain-containing protein, partial [Planctomycetia bacterium]|nr:SPFH domain-containing protein [Planctomycetia bacterium]